MAVVLLVILCFTTLLCVRKWSKLTQYYRTFNLLERFSGPPAYLLIGTVPYMLFTDFYKWANAMCQQYGDPVRFWRFGHPMIFISSYKYAVQLLTKSNFNGKLQDLDMIYRHPGGKGLSTMQADIHSQKRKMLAPAFSRAIVEGSVEAFSEETKILLNTLQKFAVTGDAFNMVDYMMTCLFHMVARSDFGDTFMENRNDNTARQHMQALHTIAETLSKRILGPNLLLRKDFIFFLTKDGKATRKAGNTLNSFALQAVEKRRLYRKTVTGEHNICYLDILLDLMDSGLMNEDDVISELNNFMGGAYDTTALTICWTLFLLALNPQHQEKVYEELQHIFKSLPSSSSSEYTLTANDTKEMKYLELCLKESLRLFPPAPIFPRSTVTDMKLDDGRIIPGKVDVLIFANLIHRDPEYFPNPEKFDPERHLEPIPAFMPFSMGVRNCIGQVYGMYQSKVVLAYLIREFVWETTESWESVEIAYQGLLYPKNGLHFKIKRRC
ncbi:unnamed protein product [Orchesella dallaii]|uniref:Cytochrome P450 n=1 Tax=Orchesella dallaii TaxID=48710 RepID=A0ABP1RG01_9HEXA